MLKLRICFPCLLILLLPIFSTAGGAQPIPRLATPPLGERWFGISMNDDRTGFASIRIDATPGGYEISGEGSAKMLVLGFSREASARERYLVNRDLSLKSFSAEQVIDGSPLRLQGEVTARGVKVVVETRGSRQERLLKVKGPIYPPPVLNILPLVQGAATGKSYRVQMLDIEAVKVKEVKITVVGRETLADGRGAIHLQNDLYTFVDNDIWVDLAGNTIRESVRDGLIVTRAEDEQTARGFLAEAAVAKKDLILDFSLVRVATPIQRPLELKGMVAELTGVPAALPLPEGGGQRAERLADGRVRFTVTSHLPKTPAGGSGLESAEAGRYLQATDRILADNGEIRARKDDVLSGEREPLKAAVKLSSWVAATVEDAVIDSQSPLETLASGRGNCQSHARLYASLARAAGIPTRIVSGLVYVAGQGFLYHSWAESHVGEWVAVDPTFGQVPADATHIRLVEGDSPADMAPLAGMIGRVKVEVLEQRY